ncbi:MAG: CBS domain-containing protein, partial [Exiguobacterium sp.]
DRIRHILNRPVMELARRKVVTADADTEMEEIAATLGSKRIKKLPILKAGRLVGIISRGDVIRHSFKQFI